MGHCSVFVEKESCFLVGIDTWCWKNVFADCPFFLLFSCWDHTVAFSLDHLWRLRFAPFFTLRLDYRELSSFPPSCLTSLYSQCLYKCTIFVESWRPVAGMEVGMAARFTASFSEKRIMVTIFFFDIAYITRKEKLKWTCWHGTGQNATY